MPDLSFSNTGSIVDNWTCQQLVNQGTVNLGYDTKAPTKEDKPEEEKVEDNGE